MADIFVNILGDASKLKGELDKAGKNVTSFSEKLGKIGKIATIGGAAVTGAFALIVKSAIGFNKEMANIATLIPKSTERVDELKSAIRTMAVDVGKDTADLAQGAYQVISAFGDTADTVAILEISAKAATAGVATTTDAINLLSAVTKGYGDTSKEAVKKASDLAFQTVTLGQTTFPELAASMGKVIPLASELGVKQEELFAVMATATGVTGKASEVATQLRGVLQSLMAPTKDMTDLYEGMGYESGEAMLRGEGLSGAIDAIIKKAEETGVPLQNFIGSIEGQTLALTLAGSQADVYDEKLAAMGDSVGLTDIAFKEQTEGVNEAGFAFKQAIIQITTMGQEIGDKLLPMLVPLIQKFTEIIGKISDWAKENAPLVETIVKVGAVIGVIAAVGGPILMAVAAFSAIAPAIALIGTIATGPIGLLIIAVTAIIAIWKNWDRIVEFVSGFVEKIKNYLEELKTIAIQKVTEMIDWIIEKFKDLADLPKKMLDWGKNAMTGFADGIKGATSKVTDGIKGAANKVKNFFGFESPPREGPLSGSDKWMPNMMTMFGKGITDNLDLVYEPVETLSTGMLDIFERLKNDFKSNIVDPIIGYLENQLTYAITGLLGGIEDFEWSWKNFWEGLKNTLINAVAAMIAKLIVLAAFKWLFPFLSFEKGGGVGYDLGGQVKKFQFGGMADTIPARLTVGEYVVAKPMVDFIKNVGAIPGNLIDAISRGLPTPAPMALAGGGAVGYSGTISSFGETKIYVDIHDNRISDELDIKRLASTVSNEILRKINLNRRH